MAHTGHKCERSGIYQGQDSCKVQIALSKGDTFPPCGQCGKGVDWTLIRATQN
jgi:hypothetical protein